MKRSFVTTSLLLILSNFLMAQTPNASTTEKDAITVVQSFLDAVKDKSHAKVNVLLDPQIEWDQPGNNRTSGIKKTSDEVFKMFGILFKMSASTLKLTDVKVIAVNGNSVACHLHWNAVQPTGKVLDVDNIDVYTIKDGKITKAKIFSADIEKENDFWGHD